MDRPVPYGKNPRLPSDRAVGKVAASIKEFGWRQCIVVDADGVIVAGHKRQLAAKLLDLAVVPVHVAKDLTPAQAKAYRLMDNRAQEDSEWDLDLLASEMGELAALEMDLPKLTGFEQAEIIEFLKASAGVPEDLGGPPDSVEENAAELQDMKDLRKKGNAAIQSKTDTERYLVIVFPSREAKEAKLSAMGVSPSERYLSAGSVRLQYLGGNITHGEAAPLNKSGATG